MRRGRPFAEFAPEIKDNSPFGNTISTTIDQDFICGYTVSLLYGNSIFRWNDLDVSVIGLTWAINLNNWVRVVFGNSAFDGLRGDYIINSFALSVQEDSYQDPVRVIWTHPPFVERR